MKFQPVIKISNLLYNWHFSNPGWEFDTTQVRIPCLFKKKKDDDFKSMFQMKRLETCQSYKMLTRIYKFHGIQKLQLKRWQSQIRWKCEEKSK